MAPRSPAEGASMDVRLDVVGSGRVEIATGLAVLDDLLALCMRTGGFDLELVCEQDVPSERLVQQAGRALGAALAEAMAAAGARRIGDATAPADEALAEVALEASGRPLVVSNVDLTAEHLGGLHQDLLRVLLDSLAETAGLTVHVRLLHGDDSRHVADAVAKALGLALAQACALRPGA